MKIKMLVKFKTAGILFLLILFGSDLVRAQTTIIRGVLTDSASKETLPYANVQIPGTTIGALADEDGRYSIKLEGNYTKIQFGYIGYNTAVRSITPGIDQIINVKLSVNASMLTEVVVKGKARYRNRNNPAVELIQKVIDHKKENQMDANEYVQYEQYEKISLALSNLSDKFRERRVFKNYQFLFTEQDSGSIGGKNMLPAYLRERLSQIYFRKDPYKKKQRVLADQRAEYDSRFIDNDGLSTYFNRLYEDINIYNNNISIVTNLFLSPIANNAPVFYKFFITDTVKIPEHYSQSDLRTDW